MSLPGVLSQVCHWDVHFENKVFFFSKIPKMTEIWNDKWAEVVIGAATTFGITTFSIETPSMMTLSINGLLATLSINDTQHKITKNTLYQEPLSWVCSLIYPYAKCWILLCWMSLWWVPLCWMSFCLVLLCHVIMLSVVPLCCRVLHFIYSYAECH